METTLCFLRKGNKILLAEKQRGFGQGKLNGVGGKLEKGETPEQAMIRETQEEIFVTPTNFEKVAEVEFDEFYKRQKKIIIYMFILHMSGKVSRRKVKK